MAARRRRRSLPGPLEERETRILIAIEPRSYREAIGEVIRAHRPSDEVTIAAPEEAARELYRLDPDLGVCSFPGDHVPGGRPAWVEFRPYERPQARVCLGGSLREVAELDLECLLALAQETEALLRADPTAGGC